MEKCIHANEVVVVLTKRKVYASKEETVSDSTHCPKLFSFSTLTFLCRSREG